MPLKKGSSKKVISGNIREMSHSTGHAERVRKHGEAKAHQMEVAASLGKANSKKKGKR